jgi:rubrerythrin
MVLELTATEIVDIAKQIEACGEAFYEMAKEHAQDPALRALFESLREEEQRHTAVFESMLGPFRSGFVEWRENERYLGYLATFGQNRVFPDVDSVAAAVLALPDDDSALRLALSFEREAILFLNGLRPLVREEARSLLDELIGEEHGHVIALTGMLDGRAARRQQA